VAVLAAAGVLAAGCSDSATERTGAAPPRHASFANAPLVGRGDGSVHLLSIRGMGSFSVSCARGLPKVGFRAGGAATLHATVDGTGRVRSAFLDPGQGLAPRAKGGVLVQHWQNGARGSGWSQQQSRRIQLHRQRYQRCGQHQKRVLENDVANREP